MSAAADAGDHLRLQTWFGERDRVEGRLLADALLDLYETHRVRSSIVLRGAEGFGRLHHLRTEDLLSLSEDLPVTAIAIDRRERIEQLLRPVSEIMTRGLIALQPVTVADEPAGADPPPGTSALTIEVGRGDRVGHVPAYVAVCDLLHREGVAGATVLLGVDGTRRATRTRARFFARNGEVPMTITAVGEGPAIAAALGRLRTVLRDPLLTLAPVQICKRDGELLERPASLPETDARGLGLWQKLTVYTAQSALHDTRPVSSAIVRRLRSGDTAGVTSLRGIWGFHGDHRPHGDRLWQLRRNVPVATVCLDTPSQIAAAFDIVDELTVEQGLVTCEAVPAMRALSAARTVGGYALASLPG